MSIDDGKPYPARCPEGLSAAMSWTLWAPRVTYRRHGLRGELRKPMVHRFVVKGGTALANVMAENIITRPTPLLDRLLGRVRAA